jgi:hypothetical protein
MEGGREHVHFKWIQKETIGIKALGHRLMGKTKGEN